MISPAVQSFSQCVWDAREAGTLPHADELDRRLSLAIAEDVASHKAYVPREDRRVEWLRELIRQRTLLRPQYRPETPDYDAAIAWIIGREDHRQPCGKDLACKD